MEIIACFREIIYVEHGKTLQGIKHTHMEAIDNVMFTQAHSTAAIVSSIYLDIEHAVNPFSNVSGELSISFLKIIHSTLYNSDKMNPHTLYLNGMDSNAFLKCQCVLISYGTPLYKNSSWTGSNMQVS